MLEKIKNKILVNKEIWDEKYSRIIKLFNNINHIIFCQYKKVFK